MKTAESSLKEIETTTHTSHKGHYAALARSSNIYASLPNHGSHVRQSATRNGADEVVCNTDYCTTERQTKNNTKQWLKSSNSNKMSTATTTSHVTETEAAGATNAKLPPYINLNNDEEEDDDFGMSNNLSTESIKNACDRFDDDEDEHIVDDDVSDDDLIEVKHTPHCFQKSTQPARRSLRQQTALTIDRQRMRRRKLDEHPLCTLPRSSSNHGSHSADATKNFKNSTNAAQDEVNDVLNALDAILDVHGGIGDSSSMLDTSLTNNDADTDAMTRTHIEDCLLDLDNYLDGIDDDGSLLNYGTDDDIEEGNATPLTPRAALAKRRHRTLPKNLRATATTAASTTPTHDAAALSLQRGHKLRKTISADMKTEHCNSGATSEVAACVSNAAAVTTTSRDIIDTLATPTFDASTPPSQEWRRHSMRKTAPLHLPANCEAQQLPTIDITAATVQLLQLSPTQDNNGINVAAALRRSQSQCNVRSSVESNDEMLTTANIFQNLLDQNEHAAATANMDGAERPRQYGRRVQQSGVGRILTMDAATVRPMSAPARQTSGTFISSEPSSLASSRNASPVSLVSSSDGSSDSSSTTTLHITHDDALPSGGGGGLNIHNTATASITTTTSATPSSSACQTSSPLDPDNIQLLPRAGHNAAWPHSFSRILALMGCSVGLFNLCRFAILTIQYGGNFLLQFLLLSFIFGVPLFWLQMCLGSKIKAGPVSMWKISPICRGIGIALLLLQCVLTIYSSVGVAWVLVYLRDSFLGKNTGAQPQHYRWQEPYFSYRHQSLYQLQHNNSANLTETLADYFNGVVLQRLQMVRRADASGPRFSVNDRLAFNLALIWACVFLVLCKGLKSYGKAVLGLAIVPLVMLIVITCKLLTVIDLTTLQNIFSAADFEEFLINSKTWSAAAQEAFLTWGLWGPSVIAMSSRLHANVQSKQVLRRDAILVVVTTLFGLSLAALLGLVCVQILKEHNYIYIPGSFEHMETYTSVYSLKAPINTALISYPTKWVPHYSTLLGETFRRPTALPNRESGYQALRLISELFPAAMALAIDSVAWPWTAAAFAMFFIFGLAQMCAMWKPISSALGNSTSSVLLSCVTALLLSIPFATEMGISIVHYMDLLLGGAWFVPLLWTAQIFGVFLIRGRPYNGDDLVNDLRMSGSMSAFLALSWNVLLPIGLVALAVVEYKISNSSQFYIWRGSFYFSLWSRKLAGLVQIGFLLLVPVTAIIQIYRYLASGPSDILDRIQLLYRPTEELLAGRTRSSGDGNNLSGALNDLARNRINNLNNSITAPTGHDDAPPKYTPPPSYTTATGARLAKILRQSIRRSVRRLMHPTTASGRTRPVLPVSTQLPPDYAVLHMNDANVEFGQQQSLCSASSSSGGGGGDSYAQRAVTLGRNINLQKLNLLDIASTTPTGAATLQRPHSSATAQHAAATLRHSGRVPSGRPYTAQDVATILRSSTRRIHGGGGSGANNNATASVPATTPTALPLTPTHSEQSDELDGSTYSADNLIMHAQPLGESAAIAGCNGAADATVI